MFGDASKLTLAIPRARRRSVALGALAGLGVARVWRCQTNRSGRGGDGRADTEADGKRQPAAVVDQEH